MDQLVVKIEDQSNGEILLYYVDENGDHQEGVLTTIENIENSTIPIQDNSYILSNLDDFVGAPPIQEQVEELPEQWTAEDIKRLLLFYTDNKPSFVSGTTQKKHLWAVACKTMLIGKNQETCEAKLHELKSKYIEFREYIEKGIQVKWPFFDLSHQAFHDDPAVAEALDVLRKQLTNNVNVITQEIIKPVATNQQPKPKVGDEKIIQLLNLYLKYKQNFRKEYWRRDLWDTIAFEMGENDGEYLQKRFHNYKQHYINLLVQSRETGVQGNWPYLQLFNQIFDDDIQFQKKYLKGETEAIQVNNIKSEEAWDVPQKTLLAKYVYDSFQDFADPKIPDNFLWTEIGEILSKPADICQSKFESLKTEHIQKYLAGEYNLQNRDAMSIIFDYLIAKETKQELSNTANLTDDAPWSVEETDELIKFFYDNVSLFKDSVGHFVCFEVMAEKLGRDLDSCKKQWDELLGLYKSILNDKKEIPDMQIDWRYIDMFDRMFDYGMDMACIEELDDLAQNKAPTTKIGVKKITIQDDKLTNIKSEANPIENNTIEDFPSDSEPRTDPRSTQILEHYLKNKEKFQRYRNKLPLWSTLAQEIGMNSTQCSHRFKFLQQTYMEQVQKQIDQPKCLITWPYFALCKKVFGYRIIKNKLKQTKGDNDTWLAREIKQLISFFSKNFHEISNNTDDLSIWAPLSEELGKSERCCKDKFVDLRKCYRKLKSRRSRNPDVKISWCYYNMFDRIYSIKEGEDVTMEIEALDDEEHWETEGLENVEGTDDDYQCIIVLPEGQEFEDINDAQIVMDQSDYTDNNPKLEIEIEPLPQSQKTTSKWTKRSKKRLLVFYINYIRSHRNKEIISKDMWKTIAAKLSNKTPANCRKMFTKMQNSFRNADDITKLHSPFTYLLEKTLRLKLKLAKITPKSKEGKVYKDVVMAPEKVLMALSYYLENIDDFLNPQFEKKFLWTQLANHVTESVTKVYAKINYLKQEFVLNDNFVNQHEFSHILKEIIAKESEDQFDLRSDLESYFEAENSWSEDDIEILLNWYLSNLEKFKNPKLNRSYLWMDASKILNKNPVVCSKKMIEIRTLYRNMVKQNVDELKNWRFLELCQKIYGTGKKGFDSN